MKCLILGGCGFIGSYVSEVLLEHGYQVRILDKENVNTGRIAHMLGDVELLQGNYANRSVIEEALEGIDYVIHLIGTTLPKASCENPVYDIETDVVPTVNLLTTASKISRIRKVIFSSSGGTIYGLPNKVPIPEGHPTFPICPYGISKLVIEKYLHYFYVSKGLNYTSLRISNPYGERQNIHGRQGAISVFMGRIAEGKEIEIWGDGQTGRDFIYVKDVAEAFVNTMEYEGSCKIFNVGSGNMTSLNQLIHLIEEISVRKAKIRYLQNRDFDLPENVLDIRKIRDEVKWEPQTPLVEGLGKMWEFIRSTEK